MAARDGKVSRFDIVSVVIASLSLAVSGYFGYGGDPGGSWRDILQITAKYPIGWVGLSTKYTPWI
jgi:hypothetical protein